MGSSLSCRTSTGPRQLGSGVVNTEVGTLQMVQEKSALQGDRALGRVGSLRYLTAFFTLMSLGSEQMDLPWTVTNLQKGREPSGVSGQEGLPEPWTSLRLH